MDTILQKVKVDGILPITKKFDNVNEPELIVVASLIESPNNIGSLCRTCEIFNVKTLVVNSLSGITKKDFLSLSMSAEKRVHFLEIKRDNLRKFLINKQSNGYKVVAAEQSTRSISLVNYKYPNKCILLMGEERMGVPPTLLNSVDETVEIPQLGETRSLNVHVSASILIYQFAAQKFI